MIGWVHNTYIHFSISESYWINISTSSYSQWRDETQFIQMCAYFLSYGYVTWSKLKVVWRVLGLEIIIVDTTKTDDTYICWWMSSWSWFVHFWLSEESKQDKGKYAPATSKHKSKLRITILINQRSGESHLSRKDGGSISTFV